jgi:hypothetical protein
MGSYDTGLDEDPTRQLVTVLELAPDDEKRMVPPQTWGWTALWICIYIYIIIISSEND